MSHSGRSTPSRPDDRGLTKSFGGVVALDGASVRSSTARSTP